MVRCAYRNSTFSRPRTWPESGCPILLSKRMIARFADSILTNRRSAPVIDTVFLSVFVSSKR